MRAGYRPEPRRHKNRPRSTPLSGRGHAQGNGPGLGGGGCSDCGRVLTPPRGSTPRTHVWGMGPAQQWHAPPEGGACTSRGPWPCTYVHARAHACRPRGFWIVAKMRREGNPQTAPDWSEHGPQATELALYGG